MKNIAFISLGSSSHSNAEYLVKSIRKRCPDFQVIQISRKIDQKIKDVNYKIDYEFKGNTLMIDKLNILSSIYKKFGSFFYSWTVT